MFQDEGRFGLLGKPRRCWAPIGVRPSVGARLLRKFSYAFAAVSPHDGVMDSLVLPWVNTETMSMFLTMVSERHENEFVIMVMDQAGWHIAAGLEVPPNMRLVFLPPTAPRSIQPNTYGTPCARTPSAIPSSAPWTPQTRPSARGY